MIRACGVVEVCSPRGPKYSGKLIARAVELYLEGVRPGYIRWHELQSTLEKEFPQELPIKGEDLPSPETVLGWARKYADAPQRLRNLRVQQSEPASSVLWGSADVWDYQSPGAVSMPYAGSAQWSITALLSQFMAMMILAMMVCFVKSWFGS